MTNKEYQILALKNRIAMLEGRNKENARIVRKLQRQLSRLQG